VKWTTLLGATALSACVSLSAHGQATEYTSQLAFNAVAPLASTFGFPGGSQLIVESNDYLYKEVDFVNNATLQDQTNSGTPLTFAIGPALTPTYGVNFLSFQNTQTSISANITSAYGAFYAIGFSYGSYVSTGGPVTLTLQNTSQFGTFPIESFTVTPTSTAQFVGFTSPTPISSVSIGYPGGYAFDLTSVTEGTAYSINAVGGSPNDPFELPFSLPYDKDQALYAEVDTSVGGDNPSDTFEFKVLQNQTEQIELQDTDGTDEGGSFSVKVVDSVNGDVLGSGEFNGSQAASGYDLSLNYSGDPSLANDPVELTLTDEGSDPNFSIKFSSPVLGVGGVPEPSAWALMLIGVAGVGAALRRRQRLCA
jgi:hypothetical protein